MRWEPLLAMVGLLALGVWLVSRPGTHPGLPPLRPDARTIELRIGDDRGALEIFDGIDGEKSFRFLFRDGSHGPAIAESEMREFLPARVYETMLANDDRVLFRLLNITTWGSLVWIAIGFGGQLVFSCRFLIQWLVSERQRESVVPEAFWWLSLIGGVCLFTYFVWRQDIVGVLGQSSGLVIYARNLRLIRKSHRRALRASVVDGERVLEVPLQPGSGDTK